MKRLHRTAILAVTCFLVASVLLVPSGAAPAEPASEVEPVELTPNEAAEGKYAFQNDDGELRIHVVGGSEAIADGIPTNSVVDLGPVFDVTNTDGTADATVFVEDDSDEVIFYVPNHGPVETHADGVIVGSETTQPIHILVNATGVEPGAVLQEMTVFVSMESSGGFPEDFNVGSAGSDGQTTTPTPESTPAPTTVTPTATVTDSLTLTSTTTSTSEPTPTDDSGGNDLASTDDPTGEEAGLDPSSLLWLLAALGALLLLFALARRRRSEE
jgi:hypothetical protein